MNTNVRFWLMMAVVIGAGVGLHLLSHGEAVPLEKPLSTLPLQLEAWRGTDIPLEPRIIQAVGVTDYLNRVYRGPDQKSSLFLYVGYYKSQRTGQSIHSPKNCLPGAGWEPVSAGHVDITLPDGQRAPVNLYVIESGLQRQVVLYWYQSHGRVIASEYWGKAYMVSDALRLNRTDATLVRVSTAIQGDPGSAVDRAVVFAQFLLRDLGRVLPN